MKSPDLRTREMQRCACRCGALGSVVRKRSSVGISSFHMGRPKMFQVPLRQLGTANVVDSHLGHPSSSRQDMDGQMFQGSKLRVNFAQAGGLAGWVGNRRSIFSPPLSLNRRLMYDLNSLVIYHIEG